MMNQLKNLDHINNIFSQISIGYKINYVWVDMYICVVYKFMYECHIFFVCKGSDRIKQGKSVHSHIQI